MLIKAIGLWGKFMDTIERRTHTKTHVDVNTDIFRDTHAHVNKHFSLFQVHFSFIWFELLETNQTANQLDPYLDNENDYLSLRAEICVLLTQSYFALVRSLN